MKCGKCFVLQKVEKILVKTLKKLEKENILTIE